MSIGKRAIGLGLAAVLGWAAGVRGESGGLERHGVPAAVSESRGVVAVGPGEGMGHLLVSLPMDRIAEALRASVLVVDAATGKAGQYFWPDERTANDAPFHLLVSRDRRRLYTTFGGTLVEFDLVRRAYTYASPAGAKLAGPAMSLAEGPDGRVYAGVYPTCQLVEFDPKAQTLRTLAKLDPAEKYPSSMAATADGWVYVGIGTARRNLVAYHPATGERRGLLDEARRTTGTVAVRIGTDEVAYARVGDPAEWMRLRDGKAEPVAGTPAIAEGTGGMPWQEARTRFTDGAEVRGFDLGTRRLTFVPAGGTAREVAFDYKSEGAAIASLSVGADGTVWGNTSHPMRLFSVPSDGSIRPLGGIERVGGGNFPALVESRGRVYGVSYSGGDLYEYDPAMAWAPEPAGATETNPRVIGQFRPHLQRPRAGLALADGRTLVFGGFPGYGRVGGGLLVYDLETRKQRGLTADNLAAAGQSPVSLAQLPNGRVTIGTSVLTPGGGHPVAETAEVLVVDPADNWRVVSRAAVPGATEVVSLLPTKAGGVILGLTRESVLVAIDLSSGRIVHHEDVRHLGAPPAAAQRALLRDGDGRAWLLLSGGIASLDEAGYKIQQIVATKEPVTAVGATAGGRIWFGSGSALWSWTPPPGK